MSRDGMRDGMQQGAERNGTKSVKIPMRVLYHLNANEFLIFNITNNKSRFPKFSRFYTPKSVSTSLICLLISYPALFATDSSRNYSLQVNSKFLFSERIRE
jgi:hypothetical protein